MGDAMSFDHRPDAVRVREVRRTVIHKECRTQHESAADSPRPHHPTDIGVPEEDVTGLNVEAMRHVLCALDREAAVDMLCALGLACGARCVNDHVKLFGISLDGGAFRRLVSDKVMPPYVALGIPRHIAA